MLYAVSKATATGFVIRLASPAPEDVTFSWHALSTDTPLTTQGAVVERIPLQVELEPQGILPKGLDQGAHLLEQLHIPPGLGRKRELFPHQFTARGTHPSAQFRFAE